MKIRLKYFLSNILINMYLNVNSTLIKTILSFEITIDPTTNVNETARIAIRSKQFAGIDSSDLICPILGRA